MSEVGTISGDVRANMEGFSQEVLNMSTAFGLAEVDTAKALYQTISSGILDAKEAMEVLDGAVRLSIGGLAELSETVDVLTSIINAYGMSSRDVAEINDILFTTVRRGKTTIPLLANSLGNIIPIAAQTGVSLKEVSASVGALTLAGIDTRTAGIYVRQMLNSMIKPSQAANDLVKQLNIGLEDQKFAFNAVALEQKGFRGMLEDVMKATEGNVTQLGVLFDNVRALTGATALTGNQFEDFISILNDFEVATGAASDAFELMMLDPGRKMETILNALRQGFMGLGQSMLTGITGPIKSFEDLENAATGIRDGIAQMGPVMVSMLGQLVTVISLLMRGIAGFTDMLTMLPGVTDEVAARMKTSGERTRNFAGVLEEVGLSMATGGADISTAFDKINKSILNDKKALHEFTLEGISKTQRLRGELLMLNSELSKVQGPTVAPVGWTGPAYTPEFLRRAVNEGQSFWTKVAQQVAHGGKQQSIAQLDHEALVIQLESMIRSVEDQLKEAGVDLAQSKLLYGREIGTSIEEQLRFAFVDSDIDETINRISSMVYDGTFENLFAGLKSRVKAGNASVKELMAGGAVEAAESVMVEMQEMHELTGTQINSFIETLNQQLAERVDLSDETREAMQERINEIFARLGGEAAAIFADAFGVGVEVEEPQNALHQLYKQILDTDTAMANAAATSVTSFASGMANAFVAVMDGSKSAKEAFADFGRSFLAQIAQMIIQAYILQGLVRMIPGLGKFLGVSVVGQADGGVNEGGLGQLYPLATGGVVQGGLTRVHPYANGGPIVKGPHVALIGEGKMNEAVVPLPDGKSIPVQMQGGQSANVSVNIQAVDAAGVEELLFRRRDTLKDIIAEAMMSDRGFRGTMGGATG